MSQKDRNCGHLNKENTVSFIFFVIYKNAHFGDDAENYNGRNFKYKFACFSDSIGNDTWPHGIHSAGEFGADGIYSIGLRSDIFNLTVYRKGDKNVKEYRREHSITFFNLKNAKLILHPVILLIPYSDDESYEVQTDRLEIISNMLNNGVATPENITRFLASLKNNSGLPNPPRIVYLGGGSSQPWKPPSYPTPTRPYTVTLDHGQITVDPTEPRFDPGAGETGQWIDPSAPSLPFSSYN